MIDKILLFKFSSSVITVIGESPIRANTNKITDSFCVKNLSSNI